MITRLSAINHFSKFCLRGGHHVAAMLSTAGCDRSLGGAGRIRTNLLPVNLRDSSWYSWSYGWIQTGWNLKFERLDRRKLSTCTVSCHEVIFIFARCWLLSVKYVGIFACALCKKDVGTILQLYTFSTHGPIWTPSSYHFKLISVSAWVA